MSKTARLTLLIALLSCLLPSIVPAQQPPAKAPAKAKARTDCFGDPLPVGAVARLGTVRFTRCHCAAYSPDGKMIATGYRDSVYLCDAKSGKRLRRLPFSGYRVCGIIFSSDGKQMAVIGFGGGDIDLWDLETFQRKILEQPDGTGGGPDWEASAVFSRDGKTLYAATAYTLAHWDTKTGKKLRQYPLRIKGKNLRFRIVVFAPDAKILATEGYGTVYLWDVETGTFKRRLAMKDKSFSCFRFSNDGKLLATAPFGEDVIQLWNVATGKKTRVFKGPALSARSLAFSADGKMLVSAYSWFDEQSILFHDLSALSKPAQRVAAPGVSAVMFSPDQKTIAWRSYEKTLCFFDLATKKEIKRLPCHRSTVESVAFSRDRKMIASGSEDKTVRIWDARSGKQLRVLRGHKSCVNAVAFSPDGRLLASASGDMTISLWNPMTGKKKFVLKDDERGVSDVAFSPDGKLLAAASWKVVLWDPIRGLKISQRSKGIIHLAFSPNGKTFAGAVADTRPAIILLQLKGKNSRKFSIDKSITSVAYSPNGRIIAVGCNEKLYLLDAPTGKKLKVLPGHANGRGCVAFSPDGRYLASGGTGAWQPNNPQMLQIFELLTYTEIHRFKRDVPVYSVAFSPDGSKLATGREDATALIWDLQNLKGKRFRANLSVKELAVCWQALAQAKASDAYDARVALLHARGSAVPFLAQRLRPAPGAEKEHIEKLIKELGQDNFKRRTKAMHELKQLAELAKEPLAKALKRNLTLEAHLRIEKLLAAIATIPPPHRLQELRAVEILENIGTPEAKRTLQRLARGNPAGLVTQQARQALQRLKKAK